MPDQPPNSGWVTPAILSVLARYRIEDILMHTEEFEVSASLAPKPQYYAID